MSAGPEARMIQVLVVEDSPVVRNYLVYLLERDPGIRVMGTVGSGEAALDFVNARRPDAILMDIHLPGIDGLETTRRIMSTAPIPIVVCTASARFKDIKIAMSALEAGALAVMRKPGGLGAPDAEGEAADLVDTLKLMSEVRLVKRWNRAAPARALPSDTAAERAKRDASVPDAAVVVMGASTGGPPVIATILSSLPPSFPIPIIIVQHISIGFTAGFAEWLSTASRLPVCVASDGTVPLPGHVYIAPDDLNLRVGRGGELRTARDEPRNSVRPSVGILFGSATERYGSRAVGVLLTGMGRDGAEELKAMADAGSLTIAQDEESCAVFGMPGEAIRLCAARYALPPRMIAEYLIAAVRRDTRKGGIDG